MTIYVYFYIYTFILHCLKKIKNPEFWLSPLIVRKLTFDDKGNPLSFLCTLIFKGVLSMILIFYLINVVLHSGRPDVSYGFGKKVSEREGT